MCALPRLQLAAVRLRRLRGARHVAAQADVEVGIEAAITALHDRRIAVKAQWLVGCRVAATGDRLGLRRLAGRNARIPGLSLHALPQRFAALVLAAFRATGCCGRSSGSGRCCGWGGERFRIQPPAGCQATAQGIAASPRAVFGRCPRDLECGCNRGRQGGSLGRQSFSAVLSRRRAAGARGRLDAADELRAGLVLANVAFGANSRSGQHRNHREGAQRVRPRGRHAGCRSLAAVVQSRPKEMTPVRRSQDRRSPV